MQKKTGFITYDWFKLIVALLLLVAIIILWITLPASKPATEVPVVETEEVVDAEPSAEPVDEPTEEPAAVEETEEENASPADVELPPLPEPSADLEYDAANGGLVNADGELIYLLNEDGSGWTPFIPDDLQHLKLNDNWDLVDEHGTPIHNWNPRTMSWITLSGPDTLTNIVDCPGAAEPRLVGGQQAEALRNVNFRSSPGVADNWIGSFVAGDQVMIMGTTECTPYGNGAYLWWLVERTDGLVGWVAEAKANSPSYFLVPVE